jgi:uncharacterized membrane protein
LKVYETRLRSIAKAGSFRLIEIAVDTFILSHFVKNIGTAFGLSIAVELICLTVDFFFERVWNNVRWGRKIIKEDCDSQKEEK